MVGFFQPNTVALDGFHHSVDGLILGDDSTLEGGAHLAQTTALSFLNAFNGYARHTAHHLRHVDFVYRQNFLAFATFPHQLHALQTILHLRLLVAVAGCQFKVLVRHSFLLASLHLHNIFLQVEDGLWNRGMAVMNV